MIQSLFQLKKQSLIAMLVLMLTLPLYIGCKSTIETQIQTQNIYTDPESLSFSNEHRAYMIRQVYLNLAYTFPPESTVEEILNATDEDASQLAYEEAIDDLIDSDLLKERLIDYFIKMFAVGDKYSGTEAARYPANLGAFVFLSNNPIDELLLANYAIDDDGNTVTQTYAGGPPLNTQAGYITMEYFAQKYMNTQFMLKMIREVLGLNLNTKAPFPDIELYRWDADTINPKYVMQADNPLQCIACHGAMNNLRSAFHKYNGAYNTYDSGLSQGTNQYGQEDDSTGADVLEPRASNMPLSTAQSRPLYKLTEDGEEIASPKDLALALTQHPNFTRAWTERMLTILLNIDEGNPGVGLVVPNHFSSNDAEVGFLDKWTEKFEELDRRPKAFFKAFLKSNQYLVTGANPDEEGQL